MKRIDTHSHVIPETIIHAMRQQPKLYKTRIEGERGGYRFVRGKTRFDLIPEFYDADAKVESMDRKGIDFRNFYFDALTHDPRATRHLLEMAGSEHVVIGTDYQEPQIEKSIEISRPDIQNSDPQPQTAGPARARRLWRHGRGHEHAARARRPADSSSSPD